MPNPIAFTIREAPAPVVHQISLDPSVGGRLQARNAGRHPALLAVASVAIIDKMRAGIFDACDLEVLAEGDWTNAILIVAPQLANPPRAAEERKEAAATDSDFLQFVKRVVPEIGPLAESLIAAIRSSGIDGHLEREGFRWVNRPLNSFTLTPQTRVKNFNFTLYGGPERFGVTDFIKSDQNGYSRGWVRSEGDIPKFVELARIAHLRKKR